MNDRVFILSPTAFGYEDRMREAIERIGYKAMRMEERTGNGFFSKVLIRFGLIHFFPWILRRHVAKIIARMDTFRADTLLLIDPETITGSELAEIKAAFPDIEILIYTYDSLALKSIGSRAFEIADKVYSFDVADCEHHPDLHHLPLFHNETAHHKRGAVEKDIEFLFIGTARRFRIRLLAKIGEQLRAEGRSHHFYLMSISPVHRIGHTLLAWYYGYAGVLTQEKMPYEKFMASTARARCVIDLANREQSGLTMRTFETVFSNTCLLTSNTEIARYDFYSPDSIFLLDEDKIVLPPPEVLSAPCNSAFFEKYSIDTWAKTVMSKRTGSYFR